MTNDPQSAIRNPQLAFGLGVLALALAALGQWLLDRREVGPALLGVGALIGGAAVFAGADRRGGDAPPAGEHGLPADLPVEIAGGRRGGQVWGLVAAACGIVALTLPGFASLARVGGQAADAGSANGPWLVWLAGVGVFGLAALLGGSGRRAAHFAQATPGLSRGGVAFALFGILLVAALFRFADLDSVPRGFWVDEAISGEHARHILTDPAFRPVYLGGGNGEPAFYLYGIAGLIGLLGPTVFAVRLLMAAFGVAGVAALFWLARPLFGPRVALLGAAVLAGMTWHVNFSRIAFNPVWSIPVDLLAAGCLLRGLAGRGRGWYLAAGLLFGLGFHLYYISRTWLALSAVVVLARLLTERGLWARARGGLALAGVGLLVAAAPVLTYAVVNPVDYLARAGQVSVFSAGAEAGSLEPLLTNMARHLAMFNGEGDPNGRHNIPGARMLDLATAALLPVGLALAAAWGLRRRAVVARWPYLLLLVSPLFLLAGGYLSNPADSPQALRTLGITPIVALLTALPGARLWAWGDAWWQARRAAHAPPVASRNPFALPFLDLPWGTALAVLLCLGIMGANYYRYFTAQEGHAQVWDKFATAQTLIAEAVNREGAATDIYTIIGFHGHPTIAFLANSPGGTLFRGLHELPLPPGRDALLFLDRRNGQAVPWLQALYPHAIVDAPTAPGGGDPVLFAVRIPAADREKALHTPPVPLTGLTGAYWPGAGGSAPPAFRRRDPLPSWFFWYDPISGGNQPFTVVWEGTLDAPQPGEYTFAVRLIGQAELWLDGRQVFAVDAGVPQQNDLLGNVRVSLAAGPHPVRLVLRAPGWLTPIYWYWTPPGGQQEIIPYHVFRPLP
jgi:4-amino-4-deoxy-L-arabinose transferase-like glycosyltransferase